MTDVSDLSNYSEWEEGGNMSQAVPPPPPTHIHSDRCSRIQARRSEPCPLIPHAGTTHSFWWSSWEEMPLMLRHAPWGRNSGCRGVTVGHRKEQQRWRWKVSPNSTCASGRAQESPEPSFCLEYQAWILATCTSSFSKLS